jgi:hypothetical protein
MAPENFFSVDEGYYEVEDYTDDQPAQ